MLSRSGSSTSSNLQRSKSTLSVKDRRRHPLQAESIDPQTAHAHALIAAHRAVNKSQARASVDLTRSESLTSNKSISRHHESNTKFSPASHLRRQRSTLQSRVPKLADTLQVPSTQNERCGKNRTDNDNIEWGVPGESYGAEPSSYRRLKRSKSLLTPVRQVYRPANRTPETTLSQAPTLRTPGSSVATSSPGFKVRLKRSFNFLRQTRSVPNRVITAPAQLQSQKSCHPEALALARGQYLEDLGQQYVVKKPSLLFSSKTRRTQKTFRKSFRTSEGIGSEALSVEPEQTLLEQLAKKSVSASLGDRLKKVFTRSKNNGPLPPQHLEASRPHFHLDLSTPSPEAGFDSYLEAEPQGTRRNSLYFPSNLERNSSDDLKKLSQKLSESESCESLCSNSKSRVTSWTNSTITNSSAGRALPYEPKRLSIIKEDGGPHQPSSSAGRHFGGVLHHPRQSPRHHFENVPALQQPLNIPPGQEVDSQRIYSALIKRLDDEQRGIEHSEVAFKETNAAREQDEVVGHYLFPASTIRRVESKGSASLTSIEEYDPLRHIETSSRNLDQQQIYVKKRQLESHRAISQPRVYALAGGNKATSTNPSHDSFDSSSIQDHDRTLEEPDIETGSVVRRQDNIMGNFGSDGFTQSTDSVYSRTTDGGPNINYVSPIESTDTIEAERDARNGLKTFSQSQYSKSRQPERPSGGNGLSFGSTTPVKGLWTERIKQQTANPEIQKPYWRSLTHYREHAQIDSADTDIGRNQNGSLQQRPDVRTVPCQLAQPHEKLQHLSQISQDSSTSSQPGKSPGSIRLKEVPQGYTPMPRTNAVVRKSQSALLNQTDSILQLEPTTVQRRASGLRVISSGNIVKALKGRKSQPILSRRQSPGKENDRIDTGSSPPVSSPGRYSVGTHGGSNTSRLRKGQSTIGFRGVDDRVRNVDYLTTLEGSPSDRLRKMLSARLSKPFDMDIPDCNRPFDSTYLGKPESSSGNRLSVATTGSVSRLPKTYGNLGPATYTAKTYGNLYPASFTGDESCDHARSEESEPTALPPLNVTSNVQRSISGLSLSLASKRIVSSLWRNGKKQEETVPGPSLAGSSAFI